MFMKKASLFPFDFLAKAVVVGKTNNQIISGERPWRKWAGGDSLKFFFSIYIQIMMTHIEEYLCFSVIVL